MNAVEMKSVTRTFGRSTALRAVSFTVPKDSICGLLGRNGAGKTTIMSIIAGQDRPATGTATVFGARPFENEAVLANISFVRDNQRYPDNYRLRHVLRIAPEFAPNWSADVASELVEGFRIPGNIPIKKFSRGQLSSVAIVLGLASRAPLTLLDEPYLGLDVSGRALFHSMLLREYTAHPRTIILSTHLIDESEALFDRVLVVDHGQVRVDSDIEDTKDLAYTLSGPSDAIERLSKGHTVVHSRTEAGIEFVTVLGRPDRNAASEARKLGAQIAPASLQQLVAAYGEVPPKSSSHSEGHRA